MATTELADIALPDQDGATVRLSDLWADGPVALVWLRHYGWTFCKSHAVQLDRAHPEFEAAGVELVLIGQAKPGDAAEFRRRQRIGLPVLADEKRVSYRAIGAKVGGVSDLLGPGVVVKGAINTLKNRAVQTRTIGHPAQLGAAAVIAPGGEIVWRHLARDASDNASPEDMLGAAAAIVAR